MELGHEAGNVGGCGGGGGKAGGNCHCRPTCPRWTPTTDQIRILKELYYNNGVRSPTAEQIQKISARLRQYGKIEGKNVFYWFQNYKARERLKKKIQGNNVPASTPTPIPAPTHWKPAEDYPINSITSASATAPAPAPPPPPYTVYTVGQMGEHGYGPVIMEKSFRDCSISSTGSSSGGGGRSQTQNYSWVGIDPRTSSYIFFGPKNSQEEEENGPVGDIEIETLPLFPMHGEDNNFHYNYNYNYNFNYNLNFNYNNNNNNNNPKYSTYDGTPTSSSSASLELSLNSYSTSASL